MLVKSCYSFIWWWHNYQLPLKLTTIPLHCYHCKNTLSPIWTQYLSECHLWITLSWFKTQFIINNVNYFTSSRLFLFSYSHSSRQQAPTALCLLPFSSYLVTTTLLPRLVLEECFSSFSPFSWIKKKKLLLVDKSYIFMGFNVVFWYAGVIINSAFFDS